MTEPMKLCGRCGITKQLSDFGNRKAALDGLNPWCKDCCREYDRQDYKKHGEKIRAASQAYRDKNREIVRARDRERNLRNREKKAAYNKSYCQKNRNAIQERMSEWSKANRDKRRQYEQRYRETHREERRLAGQKLYHATPIEKLRQKAIKNSHIRRARKRSVAIVPFEFEALAQKMDYWGNRCWICGGPKEAIDHVKPLSRGGPHILANLRPICSSCNSKKANKWPLPALTGGMKWSAKSTEDRFLSRLMVTVNPENSALFSQP